MITFNTFREYILGLKLANGKLVVDSGRKTGFIGFNTYSFSYMLSYKVSQDHIETFFSSIRQRGGFNNNPSCKHGSQYGNCIAILDPTQISIVNVGPDSIICNESVQDINITDQDHDYFKVIHRLTPFLDNVTSYISVDNSGHVFKLIDKKNRNNALIKPNQDIVEICQEAERIFRTYSVFLPNIKSKIFYEIKNNIYQKPIIFKDHLNHHCLEQQLFNSHRDQIISLTILTYLNLRFHHAASTNEKKNKMNNILINFFDAISHNL
ncbi:THAP-type domain-containing protein [Aphis craccivora]|uniref:THAP-type domain-containing protein n=1 Tax=Aphis craccivora TaxID=307492 RepID=A0A6G0VTR6_APHCR|nr:THAP-type domain-containing protein [Aphis craccivora]